MIVCGTFGKKKSVLYSNAESNRGPFAKTRAFIERRERM